jgi:hypothetical protein
MNSQVIFSILDKSIECDKYVSFHQSEYTAKQKLKEYYTKINSEHNDLVLKEDRIVRLKTDRLEEILVIIEPIIVR